MMVSRSTGSRSRGGLGSPADPAYTYPIYEAFTRLLRNPPDYPGGPDAIPASLRARLTSIGLSPDAFFVMTVGWGAAFYDPRTDRLWYVTGEPITKSQDFTPAGVTAAEMAHVLNVGRKMAAKMGWDVPGYVLEATGGTVAVSNATVSSPAVVAQTWGEMAAAGAGQGAGSGSATAQGPALTSTVSDVARDVLYDTSAVAGAATGTQTGFDSNALMWVGLAAAAFFIFRR